MENRRLNFNTFAQVENYVEKILGNTVEFYGQEINLKERGWFFSWDNASVRFGQCRVRGDYKSISLSSKLVEMNMKDNRPEIENTVLHEAAHAIEYEIYNRLSHSFVWQTIHRYIGGTGDRCYSNENVKIPKLKYTGTCITCNAKYQFARKPTKRKSCNKCNPTPTDRKFDETRLIKIKQNW